MRRLTKSIGQTPTSVAIFTNTSVAAEEVLANTPIETQIRVALALVDVLLAKGTCAVICAESEHDKQTSGRYGRFGRKIDIG